MSCWNNVVVLLICLSIFLFVSSLYQEFYLFWSKIASFSMYAWPLTGANIMSIMFKMFDKFSLYLCINNPFPPSAAYLVIVPPMLYLFPMETIFHEENIHKRHVEVNFCRYIYLINEHMWRMGVVGGCVSFRDHQDSRNAHHYFHDD